MNPYVLRLLEMANVFPCLNAVTPSSTTPLRVNVKNYTRVAFVILVKNDTTVTGSAITLHQSKTLAGGSEKALAFDKVFRNLDTVAGETWEEAAVASNTFTTLTTNSKEAIYVIDVETNTLDINDGFDCIRVGTGNGVNTTISVLAIAYPNSRGLPIPKLRAD
jgi:hypothetical protein